MSKSDETPIIIQEPKKERRDVGERVWGPYKRHEGAEILSKYSGGPWGLGDPEDRTLRKVEKEILIPNMLKKKAKSTDCKDVHDIFFKCAEEHGMYKMIYKCRPEAHNFKKCMADVLTDPKRIEESTQDYLELRSEYRRTGKRFLLKK